MFRNRLFSGLLVLGLAVPFAACDDGAPGVGRLTILLTDAPGDFHAAVVTISQVYLQGSSSEDGGRVVLLDEPFTTDLLTLANDVATLLEDEPVAEGNYAQLRFVIPGAYIEVEDDVGGTRIYASSPDYEGLPEGAVVYGTLHMPSFAQSGLKVNLPGDMLRVTGEQQILLVDFDVQQSFGRQAGHSGMWVMNPVIHGAFIEASVGVRASLELGEGVELPEIDGVQVTLADFSARLTNDEGSETTLPLEQRQNTDIFEAYFKFLLPALGPFGVEFLGPAGVTFQLDPADPIVVSPTSGQTANVHRIVSSAGTSG